LYIPHIATILLSTKNYLKLQNRMFMITERSEYVHSSEDDVVLRQKAAIDKTVNDDVDSDIDDSAYKYNETWVNPDQACNSSEKSCDEAHESFEADLGDQQVN
jgi:hypothetical protein